MKRLIKFPYEQEKEFEKFLLRPPRKKSNILIRLLFVLGFVACVVLKGVGLL
ncbi:MAG: hypothetical protein HFE71_08530 [Emergencia sp.]|jgi:hypothetical protein|nr:hypothetical protein [Emergencia sp.]